MGSLTEGERLLLDEMRMRQWAQDEAEKLLRVALTGYITREEVERLLQKQQDNLKEMLRDSSRETAETVRREFQQMIAPFNDVAQRLTVIATKAETSLDLREEDHRNLRNQVNSVLVEHQTLGRRQNKLETVVEELAKDIFGNPNDPDAPSLRRDLREHREYARERDKDAEEHRTRMLTAMEAIKADLVAQRQTLREVTEKVDRWEGYRDMAVKAGINGVKSAWRWLMATWKGRALAVAVAAMLTLNAEIPQQVAEFLGGLFEALEGANP